MPAFHGNKKLYRIVVSCIVASCLIGMSSARAEHQIADYYELSHSATSITHAPNWYQYRIDNYHPIGCGPVAWTILYAYWHSFKGKSQLFDVAPPDASVIGAHDPEVTAAADEIAATTGTSHGQFGSSVHGRTWTKDLCKGIEYAKARGYKESRCMKITGTEFNKFEHIKNYIKTDRPVILNINHEGFGILDHYVVVEGVRKRQELVAGRWRDRDVEYLANFGWGQKGGRPSEWISVRQRGANTGNVYTAGAAFLIDISGTPLPEASDANEAACKDWCGRNKPECAMCTRLAGCTPGYAPIMSFKKAGRNWYACTKKDTERSDASEKNRQDCEKWCDAHRGDRGCVKCDTRSTCGNGYIRLESWTGYGNNWHACRKEGKSARERASDSNHQDCLDWCADNKPECIECQGKVGCGIGLKKLKSWTGYGNNWYACGKSDYGRASEKNKTECETWCLNHKPLCVECKATSGCGSGQTSMMAFQGEGKNWYACRKASSAANKDACIDWCNNHKPPCAGCYPNVGCGSGMTPMEHFTGLGDNWHACRKASSQSNKEACEIWCNEHKPQCRFCSKKNRCGLRYKRMKLFKGAGENWAACKAD